MLPALATLGTRLINERETSHLIHRTTSLCLVGFLAAFRSALFKDDLRFPDLVGLGGNPGHRVTRIDDARSPFRQLSIIHGRMVG